MDDAIIQHLKHYHEGYRECMLTSLYGESFVERLGIDVDRYSPDSARRNSYNEGWGKAKNDLNLNNRISEQDIKYNLIHINPDGSEIYEFTSPYNGRITTEFGEHCPIGQCVVRAKSTYQGQNYQSIVKLNLIHFSQYKDIIIKQLITELTQHINRETNKL